MNKELKKSKRKGVFTTGIVSKAADKEIVLYFTGNKHAGENFEKILEMRPAELPLIIQMSDALSRNIPKSSTVESFCNVHARRNFLDAEGDYQREVKFIKHLYSKIFAVEKECKEKKLNWKDRLKCHQKKSVRVLNRLRRWCLKQLYLKRVDPQDSLGQAIQYLLNHWKRLTAFARIEGAPIENNEAERALKLKILERKNSLFYRSTLGAFVGDIISSIIATSKKSNVNALDWMTAIHKNQIEVKNNPEAWLPWAWNERNFLS